MTKPCAGLLVLALCATAHAGGEVGVVVTGESTLQPQLAAKLEGWLRQHGRVLVPSPLAAEAIPKLIDCFVIEDASCAQHVVEQHATTPTVVYARVDIAANSSDGTRDVTVTAYWFERGHAAVAERRQCERCTDDALLALADDLMKALAGNPPPDTAPAPMQVELPKAESPPRSRLVPAIALAGGGALLVVGAVLYATSATDDGSKPTYTDTRPAGIAMGVAGLAAIGVGAVLWFRHPDSTPTVAMTPHGAYVGWATRF